MRCVVFLALALLTGCFGGIRTPSGSDTSALHARAAIEAHDPARLQDALDRIVSWHEAAGTRTAGILRTAHDASERAAALADFGAAIPDDLALLWDRTGGHDPDDAQAWFVWYHALLGVEDALAERAFRQDVEYPPWPEHWMPVLVFEDESYFVECTDEPVAARPVLLYDPVDGARVAYTNLTTLFVTHARALEEGAVWVDGPAKHLREDLPALAAIHAQENPGILFPYAVE